MKLTGKVKDSNFIKQNSTREVRVLAGLDVFLDQKYAKFDKQNKMTHIVVSPTEDTNHAKPIMMPLQHIEISAGTQQMLLET